VRDLQGALALLTGASSGLGPHIARRLAGRGVRFVLSARRQPELDALAGELERARVVPADLSRRGEAERLAAAAGEVDVLVANAGIPASGSLETFLVEEIDRALEVNLRSAMVLARLLAPGMAARRRGHLVLMSSIGGKMPAAGASVYNATKYGIRGFGLSLRQELAGSGVGVTVICPTFVSEAGMWAETGFRAHPLAGEVKPGQVADAILDGILRDRAEVDVMPLATRLGVRVGGLVPALAAALGRRTGASAFDPAAAERQRHKR
jgi:uncharacterized protein